MGAAFLGVVLAVMFQRFLGSHPGLAVLFAAGYVSICAIGSYYKIFPPASVVDRGRK